MTLGKQQTAKKSHTLISKSFKTPLTLLCAVKELLRLVLHLIWLN